ncbi:MAG: polysaccharide biosynthesis protein [Elusimicrobia bacterium]|nr:polysaccharide biosynthesis protein [Elusimicrobiota bacterium]
MQFLLSNRAFLLRRTIIILSHLSVVVISNLFAFYLRFDGNLPNHYWELFVSSLPYLILIRGFIFFLFRLYGGIWQYPSVQDFLSIITAVSASTLVFFLAVKFLLGLEGYPISIFIMDSLVLTILVGTLRLTKKVYRYAVGRKGQKPLLIYGAGDAGEAVVRDIHNDPSSVYDPIGFIDDNAVKRGAHIRGVPILGTRADLEKILEDCKPVEILIAMPSVSPQQLRSIVKTLQPYSIRIKILPGLRAVLEGRVLFNQARDIVVEDLLSRQPVMMKDDEGLKKYLKGKVVLVTGAGGSIGSELSRQIASYKPGRLLILDRYENNIFWLSQDIKTQFPELVTECLIGDVVDSQRIDEIFERYRPQVVFHAAAHKHVSLMEDNPLEAIKNNILGTKNVADSANRFGVDSFVLISTDKAVRPLSVMGMTKKVAELYVSGFNGTSRTKFVIVRFGNVLGSNGSVIPLFERQIKNGGPVTVTHPEVRRYFMLIPEAVHLVLQSASLGDKGDMFVLEMGEQIRVADMARNLIRFMGHIPDEEIKILFIGLRSGEKMYEELYDSARETLSQTSREGVLRVCSKVRLDRTSIQSIMQKFIAVVNNGSEDEAGKILASVANGESSDREFSSSNQQSLTPPQFRSTGLNGGDQLFPMVK